MADLDDILLDFEDAEDYEDDDSTVPSLPLSKPEMVRGAMLPSSSAYDFREDFELARKADRLFDFSETKLSPLQQMFIVAYATKGTKTGACRLAGVTSAKVNKWMDNDEFAQNLQLSVEMVRDTLEQELFRRAMGGSDKLLLEAMKASNPDKYNKKQADVNIHGTMVHTWADLAKQAASIPLDCTVIDVEEEE